MKHALERIRDLAALAGSPDLTARAGKASTPARPLADVLWEAANHGLLVETYSCHATALAVYGKRWRHRPWHTCSALRFLASLGCDQEKAGFNYYTDEDEERGARYMWLLLAACVAEDEGVTL